MKEYNNEEFVEEALKRSGWTREQYDNYVEERRKNEVYTFTEDDVRIYAEYIKGKKDERKSNP